MALDLCSSAVCIYNGNDIQHIINKTNLFFMSFLGWLFFYSLHAKVIHSYFIKKGVIVNSRLITCMVITFFYSASLLSYEKMKLYALYTPSHAILKDHFFLPSI